MGRPKKEWTPGRIENGRERSPGVWEIRLRTGERYPEGHPKAGRWVQVSRTVRGNRDDAKDRVRTLGNEIADGEHRLEVDHDEDDVAGTVAELMDAWWRGRQADWEPATRKSNRSDVANRINPWLGDVRIEQLTVARVERWMRLATTEKRDGAKAVLSVNSVLTARRHLQTALDDAIRWGWLETNVARLARKPKATKPQLVDADPDKVNAAFRGLVDQDLKWAVLLALSVVTGARRGTIAAFQWRDFDLDAGTVAIAGALTRNDERELVRKGTKTGQTMVLPLDPVTAALVRRYRAKTAEDFLKLGLPLEPTTYLFRQRGRRNLKPMDPGTVTHRWRVFADAAGMPGVKFKALRGLVADYLIDEGRSPRRVADYLTHANPNTTLTRYTRRRRVGSQDDADLLGRLLHGA